MSRSNKEKISALFETAAAKMNEAIARLEEAAKQLREAQVLGKKAEIRATHIEGLTEEVVDVYTRVKRLRDEISAGTT